MVTGSNTISDDLSSITPNQENSYTPTFALDVKALGGMYANNIYIIGTDKGLGVSNAGIIQSPQSLVITSAGKIENTGAIQNTNPQDSLLSISTGDGADIVSSGSMITNGNLFLESGQNITLDKARLEKHGADNQNIISVSAKGDVNLQNSTNVQNFGELADGGNLYIDASNINIGNDVYLGVNGSIFLNAQQNLKTEGLKSILSLKDVTLTAGDMLSLNSTLIANSGNINLATTNAGSNFSLNSSSLNAEKDVNIYGAGTVSISNLGLEKAGETTKTKNFNVNAQGDLTWQNAETTLPTFTGKLDLRSNGTLDVSGSQFITNGGINLSGSGLNVNRLLQSTLDINLTASENDLNLNSGTILSADGNINVSALAGNLTANGLKATSNAGKLSLMADKNVALTNAGLDRSLLLGAQGVNIASFGNGNVTALSTDINSNQGNILVSSNLKNTLTDTTLNANKNIEVFAKDDLTLDGVITLGRAHTALNSKKNIYINSTAGAADVPAYTSAQSQLNSNGILSLTAEKNINAQNLKATGGAVLIEAGESFNTPQSIELNATGNDLLRNDPKLNSTDGSLTIQTNNTLTLDPRVHKLNATGDIDLVSKNGALALIGYSGNDGNGSEQVVKLSTETGGISLTGQNVLLQGSELKAKKDISLVATAGDVVVDGVRNNFTNKSNSTNVKKIIENLNVEKTYIASLLEQLHSNQIIKDFMILMDKYHLAYTPGYVGHVEGSPTDMATRKRIFQLRYDAFLQNYPILVSINKVPTDLNFSPPMQLTFDGISYNPYFEDVKNLKNNFDMEVLFRGLFNLKYTDKDLNQIDNEINIFNQNLNGYEHSGSNLISGEGNITLASAKGISISGSNFDAQTGVVRIEAAGTLVGEEHEIQGKYQSTVPTSVKQGKLKASVIVDGLQDSYDIGQIADENYHWRSPVTVTTINGDKGVKILTTGKTSTDNLILQGIGITSNNGDVNIEAYKNIIFDVAIENAYDKSKTTETKRKWYGKKKTTTTVETAEQSGGTSVDIDAKNINIKSQEINTPEMIGQDRTSIDLYSSQLTANGGKINIQAGGDLNFLTIDDVSMNTLDISKKSSFIGIKLNDSKTTNTRNIISELPAVLEANYIGTKSGFDTLLKGTVFNYLEGANIESGGTIALENASTTVVDTLTKESSSVIWQSMQDKGSITETGKLPSFNGSTPPVFKADGGLIVQIPVQDDLRNALEKLISEQGTEYLKNFALRNDVNWQAVKFAQENWNYKSQGLTPAAAAIIVIVITVATYGTGSSGAGAALLNTSTATTNAMANAAFASMASQATISLINNGGDPLKALKELGDSDYIKSLAVSVVSAGALSAAGGLQFMEKVEGLRQSEDIITRIVGNTAQALVNSTIGAAIDSGVNGKSLSETLEAYLLSGAMTAIQGTLAQNIKSLEAEGFSVEYVLHKISHAAAGCAAAAATRQSCEAGAIGAGVSEAVAEYLKQPKVFENVDDAISYKNQIVEVSKGIAGAVAVVTGYDSNTAMSSASNALNNNFVFLAAIPSAGEALVGLTLGAIRACATNPACISRAAQLGISITATVAANSNNNDDKKVVKPVPSSSGGSTGSPQPPEDDEVVFGTNANQQHHTWRHVDNLGLNRKTVEYSVRSDINTNISNIKAGQVYNGNVIVNGQRLQYTAFRRADGVINVGRIHGK
ncbi:MAG: tRNA nuclease CdiA-2 [Acinetobacter bereziniae]|uniref:tRNA nuclease CdiA-2 n=1 Tax=Acinetobacter bereziniae TaxID=106648 RepID=A0A833U055_ACIBZ|nr:MAG: tRNA nuclease CdiA-2 [Acinetobacter bereziniae]